MITEIKTYSPLCLPINWQSERIENNDQRFSVLKSMLKSRNEVNVCEVTWPMGYGSLEHDNLPILYQPTAVLYLHELEQEVDVVQAKLYCYDNCLAVLSLDLTIPQLVDNLDDLAITQRVEKLSNKHLSSLFEFLYQEGGRDLLIAPSTYQFFVDSKESLTSAQPLWVARMLNKAEETPVEDYFGWLKNIDKTSDVLLLGSGNSLLIDKCYFDDVHRVMVMSQFHSALMARIETIIKLSLKKFNSSYYHTDYVKDIEKDMSLHQHRNDHIEYINIQFSAAIAGVQGKRRMLLEQFNQAWQVTSQQSRIGNLSDLLQRRLNRLVTEKLSHQNRVIQTLLAFLGALTLVSLIADLTGLAQSVDHSETTGLLDAINLVSIESLITSVIVLVVLITIYFYKNHE